MRNFFLMLLFIIGGYSCINNETDSIVYYPIDCDSIINNQNNELLEDSIPVVVAFTGYFDMDNLILTVNEKIYYEGPLKTEGVLGLARTFKIEKLEEIETIGITINNMKKVDISIDGCNHIFVVKNADSKLSVTSVKKLPHFY